MTDLRAALAAALTDAMRRRDRPALAALRAASARIANAEAVPVDAVPAAGAIEAAAAGAGAADAPRRELTPADVRALVAAEAEEAESAATELDTAGRADRAAELRTGAAALRELLGG
ncbi:hypothetical protein [Nocardioides sp. SYSU D00038]|uniref:hypothetical protein n=1 Tax=Nocardioides sp. SYSU D00038 TaxID=2812554 RepID=UPI0019671777|nr:hypothetical protein [Nocardioides sp. SYSU D00038]